MTHVHDPNFPDVDPATGDEAETIQTCDNCDRPTTSTVLCPCDDEPCRLNVCSTCAVAIRRAVARSPR